MGRLMQYHLFSGCVPHTEGRWIIFLYEDDDTCVESWTYHERYGVHVSPKRPTDISIQKRKFILGTSQRDQVTQVYEHQELTEQEAFEMFYDTSFINT